MRFSIIQRTARSISGLVGSRLHERLHRERRCLDAGLGVIEDQRIVRDRPPRHVAARLRFADRARCASSLPRASFASSSSSSNNARPYALMRLRMSHSSVARDGVANKRPADCRANHDDRRRRAGSALQHVRLVRLQIRLDARILRIQVRQLARAVGDALQSTLTPARRASSRPHNAYAVMNG